MRLLHTSDWHLGATTYNTSRDPDHALFLDWLRRRVEDDEVDVLIVAGDLFDNAQPSSEALRRYYRFLRDVSSTRLKKVVVVGGNHDSAARLDAPAEILQMLDVHVVGGLKADRDTWDRCMCPVDGLVIAAVPYVHEFRLGVRTTAADATKVRYQLERAFADLYRTLADRAQERFPGVPLVATGHLTCAGATREDYPVEIHQAATFGGLPATIFDPRFRYVALGHIHASYGISGSNAWYSGSPIALGLREAATSRHVLLVDIANDGEAVVTPVPVPRFRRLVQLEGPPDDVSMALAELTWDDPLPPLVYADLQVASYTPEAEALLYEARDMHVHTERPVIVRIRQHATVDAEVPSEPLEFARPLADQDPVDVFVRLCNARGEPVDDVLLRAFATLTDVDHELSPDEALDAELEAMQQKLFTPPEAVEGDAWQEGDAIHGLFQAALRAGRAVEVTYRTAEGARIPLVVRPERFARRGDEAVVVAVDARTQVKMTLVLAQVHKARMPAAGRPPSTS